MQITNSSAKPLNNFERNLYHSIAVFFGFSLFYILFFSPVLFTNRLLGVGDGISYFLPAYSSARTLWTNLIFSGYPIAADPQNMTWYPPGLLLSLIPGSWNAFNVLAYVLAGSFGYCYTYTLTHSKLAATATGLAYSMSGFMISHLPHTGMIHAAAWMPLIVCALEKLRHRLERGWFAIGAFAVTCCFLGGHPQISVYGIGMGVFYALFLGWSAPIGRWQYYRWAAGCIALGLGLCAIQLLPTIELSQLSVRAEMPFEQFVSYSLPTWQTLQLLFPYFFGGYTPPFHIPYWGEWNLTETTGYVGLLPLMLAAIGVIKNTNRSITLFWFGVGLICLLLSFGGDTFLGHWLYHIPVYNSFRAQGRHFIEVALAVSILAGLGIGSVQQQRISKRFVLNILAVSGIVMLIGLSSIRVWYGYFQSRASESGISDPNFLPWENPGLGFPLIIFFIGAIVLFVWSRRSNFWWTALMLLAVMAIDLFSFGWWYEWRINAPGVKVLEPSSVVSTFRDSLQVDHQRFLNVKGSEYNSLGIFPNLTRLWDFPNAGGYSPLLLSRVGKMMQMDYSGVLNPIPLKASEHQLDLMAVRYLLASSPGMTEQEGLAWAGTDSLGFWLGSEVCVTPQTVSAVTLDLPEIPYETTQIGLVTTMGCSVGIPDDAEVVQVQVTDVQGNTEVHSLRAGRDTAEHAYDCPDVQPSMQHQRAQVFGSLPVSRTGVSNCQSHDYLSMIQLSQAQHISSLELKWTDLPATLATINVKQVSLVNDQKGTSLPVTQIGISPKWRMAEEIDSGIIYENQQVLPRAWLVPETIFLKPEDILTAIHTSQLPGGQTYKPEAMALVEADSASLKASALQPTDSAKVLRIEDTQVELQTQTAAPAFLVLSDVFYPGWKASIDGKSTPIFQTNYIQRGVKVPAGEHIVRFEFHPLSFSIGVGITMASFFGGGYWLLRRKKHTSYQGD